MTLIWKGPGVLERRTGDVLCYPGDRVPEVKVDPQRIAQLIREGKIEVRR